MLKMFEFRQDTAILHGAFLSAHRQIHQENAETSSFCKLQKHQLEIVTKLVSDAVAITKRGSWSMKWDSSDALLADLRAHAVVFYAALRFNNITSNAAENYYSTASSIFPGIDWAVYVELLKSCQWSVYFIQCVNELPPDVTAFLLTGIVCQAELDFYVRYTVVQATVLKLLNFKHAPVYKSLKEAPPKFCFPFFCSDEDSSSESFTFPDLLNKTLILPDDNLDMAPELKILFHGLVTLLDVSTKLKPAVFMKKLDHVLPLISTALNHVQSETCVQVMTLASSKFCTQCIDKDSLSNYVCWETDVAYLAFLVHGGWLELSLHMKNYDVSSENLAMCKTEEIAKKLFQLLPFGKEDLCKENQFIDALMFIIDNKLIGMHHALELFVSHAYFLENEKILACLERNAPLLAKDSLRYTLLKEIMDKSSSKDRLICVFFDSLKDVNVTDQQKLLQYFLSKYELSETLKQNNFAKQMSPILNQTVNAEQVEKQIISLCLQSPKECVSRIIHQAVNGNIGQIPVLSQMLKVASSVCTYRMTDGTSLLVTELKPHFISSTLTPQQVKNVKVLILESLQVLGDKDGLKSSEFLIQCVFPCVRSDLPLESLSFSLEVFEIVLTSSLSAKRVSWLCDINLPAITICLGRLIDLSIDATSGSLKEKVVTVLNLLYELQCLSEREGLCKHDHKVPDSWIKISLASAFPVVNFYIWKLVQKFASSTFVKPDMSSSSLVWMWLSSCILEEKLTSQTKEVILNNSCSSLLTCSLAQLIPHLSLQEWLHSFVLLKECLEFFCLNSKGLLWHYRTDGDVRLAVCVEIFVDALVLLTTCEDVCFDWSYMVSSFCKALSSQINNQMEELYPRTLVMTFLQLCRLASCLEEKPMELVTVLLLDVFKIAKEGNSNNITDLFPYFYASAETMPECVARANVLGSLKKAFGRNHA